MTYDSRCRVCSDVALRDLVAGALASGLRPAEILRKYTDKFSSASSLYRHCQRHIPSSPLIPEFLDGDTTVREAASDLERVRNELVVMFDRAAARGADAAADRHATTLAGVTATLKTKFDAEQGGKEPLDYDGLIDGVTQATRTRTDWGRELAAALRVTGHDPDAANVDALADYHDTDAEQVDEALRQVGRDHMAEIRAKYHGKTETRTDPNLEMKK